MSDDKYTGRMRYRKKFSLKKFKFITVKEVEMEGWTYGDAPLIAPVEIYTYWIADSSKVKK